MWLIADYESVTLFSLKHSAATATGGKTLLIPTPYAVKMSLLDAACRTLGLTLAKQLWPQIRDLNVAVLPAQQAIVTNLFQKVLRPRRNEIPLDEPDAGPFQKTIGYREYAHLSGSLGIAVGWQEASPKEWLVNLLLNVSYLGKRGGFMQLQSMPSLSEELPVGFVVTTSAQEEFTLNGTLQVLDDCSPKLTFEQVDIYSEKNMRTGTDRILRHIVIPYRQVSSSRGYTLYQRLYG